MAREILFKAKNCKGQWIESYPAKEENGWLMWDGNGFGTAIDINTICQFTGLTDNNGNKIWENDVVKYLEDGEIYKCNWDVGNCEYMLCNEEHSFGLGYCIGGELEVLGNTFDNPELLGGGE